MDRGFKRRFNFVQRHECEIQNGKGRKKLRFVIDEDKDAVVKICEMKVW
ncbi:MAG: hypothetical protein L6V93_17050 [Clostridiales bacterium]|nr:MAG: hypothetical protein L6V93_17050 [Clostridiales bacterium]